MSARCCNKIMQETTVEQDIANIDFSKVTALQQKRTLAFVNHFVISTVQFLNSFLKSCEQKLMQFERKLEKVNASMVLLEAKLSSVPEVNEPTNTVESKENAIHTPEAEAEKTDQPVTQPDTAVPLEEPSQNKVVEIKSEYEKFIKMVQVGVPVDAVKLKVSLEGLDPKELERLLKK